MDRYDATAIAWAIAIAVIFVAFFTAFVIAQKDAQVGYNLRQQALIELGMAEFEPFASNSGYDFYMVPK